MKFLRPLSVIWMVASSCIGISAEVSKYGCNPQQYIKLGTVGMVYCKLPTRFKEVYWYDNEIEGSPPLASYDVRNDDKGGVGLSTGQFDILENGTLVIMLVTPSHDGTYKVVCLDNDDIMTTSRTRLVSYVIPSWNFPRINTCEDHICYKEGNADLLLKCRFEGSRPLTKLSWSRRVSGYDIRSDGESTEHYDSKTNTYSVTTSLPVKAIDSGPLSMWDCVATWITIKDIVVSRIIVDFTSGNWGQMDPPISLKVEVNSPATLECSLQGVPHFNIWKKIQADGTLECIGLQSRCDVRVTTEDTGVSITEDGDLYFPNVEFKFNGTYICIFNGTDGDSHARMVDLSVMVPPRPPYPEIEGCNGDPDCVKHSVDDDIPFHLRCTLQQFHSETSLDWDFDQGLPIEAGRVKEVVEVDKVSGHRSLTISTTIRITETPFCNQNIVVRCVVEGYVSPKVWPYTKVKLMTADSCREPEVKKRQQVDDFRKLEISYAWGVILFAVLALIIGVGIICVMIWHFGNREARPIPVLHYRNVRSTTDVTEN